MKYKKITTIEYNIKYIGFNVYCDYYDLSFEFGEDINKFTNYNESANRLECLIDIDNGKIINWDSSLSELDIYDKCVDDGTYVLYDEDMNVIDSYEGYVPNILEVNEEGYGDYLNFSVDQTGTIKNWNQHINSLDKDIFNEWKNKDY